MLEYLFDKDAGLQDCNSIKKRLQHRQFPMKIAKFLRTSIFKKICFEEHLPTEVIYKYNLYQHTDKVQDPEL